MYCWQHLHSISFEYFINPRKHPKKLEYTRQKYFYIHTLTLALIQKIFLGISFFITKLKVSIHILTVLDSKVNPLAGNILHPCAAWVVCGCYISQRCASVFRKALALEILLYNCCVLLIREDFQHYFYWTVPVSCQRLFQQDKNHHLVSNRQVAVTIFPLLYTLSVAANYPVHRLCRYYDYSFSTYLTLL